MNCVIWEKSITRKYVLSQLLYVDLLSVVYHMLAGKLIQNKFKMNKLIYIYIYIYIYVTSISSYFIFSSFM